jgi:hypothetical protein
VLRRCTATLGMLTVALILGVGPDPASAASIVSEKVTNGVDQIVPKGTPGSTMYAYYELTNPTSTTNNDLIVTGITPANSVAPVNASTSPLSIVNGSFGFDQSNLQVFLSPSDQTTQGLALQFANGGLTPGGTLNFKVSLDSSYSSATPPTLTLQAPDTNLSVFPNDTLLSYTPVYANAAYGATPLAQTPEPVSLALWSALAVAGLVRARAFRRAGRQNPSTVH